MCIGGVYLNRDIVVYYQWDRGRISYGRVALSEIITKWVEYIPKGIHGGAGLGT